MPNTTALALPGKATAFPMVILTPPKTQMTLPASSLAPLNQDVVEFQNNAGHDSKKRRSASKHGLTPLQKAILKAHQQTLAALNEAQNQAQSPFPPVVEDFDVIGNPDNLPPFTSKDGQDSVHQPFFFPLPLGVMMLSGSPLGSLASYSFEKDMQNKKRIAELLMQNQLPDVKRPIGTTQTELSTVKKPSRLKKAMAVLMLTSLGGLTAFTLIKTPRKELGSLLLNASTFAVTENLMENAFRVLI
jgi:hypothetical protein